MALRPLRRYLVWINYDGSRFPEFAKGGTGVGVMNLFHETIAQSLFGPRSLSNPEQAFLKFSPSSRTDAGVHALRSSVILQVPLSEGILDETVEKKESLLSEWNSISQLACNNGLNFSDFHSVSAGFCIRRSVQYRKYTYRIAIRRAEVDDHLRDQPSPVCFSERNYAWILPHGFDVDKARSACEQFQGVHCMASFFKHSAREKRLEPMPPDTMKNILRVSIERGEPYAINNDLYDYYNVTVVARSFLREQIRRLMSCIVRVGYGRMNLEQVKWLLRNPDPTHFYTIHIPVAPPVGLFLTDVVYNSDHYHNPVPYFQHSWDYELAEV
ncbi:hypothetical protein PFISCL1PPCAC_15346 [Pristionchus fissidentatus]|uniref:tRNA pseudouridine synthase n=1 Tax=Pristionchus fissidentatus TaxID=1538716 RepID=A0AAV5VWS7_9BILA|nr:hypothetical protein PFISCL1PPCAC_15346 [Pristionchus fissidentatus]